jgi:hypothetical protein
MGLKVFGFKILSTQTDNPLKQKIKRRKTYE